MSCIEIIYVSTFLFYSCIKSGQMSAGGGQPMDNILRAQHRETHIFCCDGHTMLPLCVYARHYICVVLCPAQSPLCMSVWTLLVAFLNNTNRYNEMSVPIFRYVLKFKRKLDFLVVDVGKSRPSGINFFTECLNGVVYIKSTTTLCTHTQREKIIK
jgi:hypothetical protein